MSYARPSRFSFLLLCLAASLACLELLNAQQAQSLAILDLEARGISTIEAVSLTDRLRSELVKTGGVTVVERGQMEQVLTEQDFQLAGCTSNECAVEIGQLLGVTSMVAGSIGRVGSTYSIDIRTIDVQTSTITQSITRDYQGRIDGLLAEMVHVARELVGGEASEPVADERPLVPEQAEVLIGEEPGQQPEPAVAPKKRGRVLFWAAVGVLTTAGGYYGYMLLTGGATDGGIDLGEPPALPSPP